MTAFLDAIGYDAVDAGPLAAGGRRFQTGSAAYGTLYGEYGNPKGTPTNAAAVKAKLSG